MKLAKVLSHIGSRTYVRTYVRSTGDALVRARPMRTCSRYHRSVRSRRAKYKRFFLLGLLRFFPPFFLALSFSVLGQRCRRLDKSSPAIRSLCKRSAKNYHVRSAKDIFSLWTRRNCERSWEVFVSGRATLLGGRRGGHEAGHVERESYYYDEKEEERESVREREREGREFIGYASTEPRSQYYRRSRDAPGFRRRLLVA